MSNILIMSGGMDIDFYIKGIFSYQLFGQTVWVTTTHISVLIVMMVLIAFCIIASRTMKKATEVPGRLQNLLEIGVSALDSMVGDNMHEKAPAFRNYIGTVFVFILFSNLSGLLGIRPPTADYGVTLALAVFIFILLNVGEFKYHKPLGYLKNLFKPMPAFFPLNLIGKFSYVISLSLRLFANLLSGLIIMALVYALLGSVAYAWPAFLHGFFDVFVGAIQAYIFCMLSMNYMYDAVGEG